MNEARRAIQLLLAAGLCAGLAACGGDPKCQGGTTGPDCLSPPPTPAPTPTPVTTVILEGSASGLRTNFIVAIPIRASARGTLQAGVDWTFPEDSIGVYWTRTPCDLAMFNAGDCQVPAFSNPAAAPKPRFVSVPNAEPGDYLLWIGNRGPSEEAVSFQVTLTTVGAAGALAAAPLDGAPEVGGYQLLR